MPIPVKFHRFPLEIAIAAKILSEANLTWLMYIGDKDVLTIMINIFQTQRWHFVPPSKVSNVKNFYDHSDLEN